MPKIQREEPETAATDGDERLVQELLSDLIRDGRLELPVLPEVSAKLLRITNDPSCDPRELADLIRRDPSVASNLLRIANSVKYSPSSTIVSLQQAVARLGLSKIREIVLIISCQNRVFDAKGFESIVRNSFRRSLGAAMFAQEVARLSRFNVEEAFLYGMLHDVGRPVLLQAIVDVQRDRNQSFDRTDVISAIEPLCSQTGHDLIVKWGLPQRVAETVRSQRESESECGTGQHACLLRLAIDLTMAVLEPSDEHEDRIRSHESIPLLNLYPSQIESLLEMRDDVQQWIESTQ